LFRRSDCRCPHIAPKQTPLATTNSMGGGCAWNSDYSVDYFCRRTDGFRARLFFIFSVLRPHQQRRNLTTNPPKPRPDRQQCEFYHQLVRGLLWRCPGGFSRSCPCTTFQATFLPAAVPARAAPDYLDQSDSGIKIFS